MNNYNKHFVQSNQSVREVLKIINDLAPNAICFVVDGDSRLLGSITDGDVRRGIISGKSLEDSILDYVQSNPVAFNQNDLTPENHESLVNKGIKLVPIVNDKKQVVDILNLMDYYSLLPVEAVIMAGGKGTRLRPLTENTPKPLLKVGDKPIIEHMIDRLIKYGIQRIHISINYLGQQLIDYFGNGSDKGVEINFIQEDEFYGTAGALRLNRSGYESDSILFMNSDLLTTVDFADMFNDFITYDGDMLVATVPYDVEVPYGVVETDAELISGLKEKPTYTYYSNAGIYLLKREHLDLIPANQFYNATDLIEELIKKDHRVINYAIRNYWLDIGKHHDFEKAQVDIKHIKL